MAAYLKLRHCSKLHCTCRTKQSYIAESGSNSPLLRSRAYSPSSIPVSASQLPLATLLHVSAVTRAHLTVQQKDVPSQQSDVCLTTVWELNSASTASTGVMAVWSSHTCKAAHRQPRYGSVVAVGDCGNKSLAGHLCCSQQGLHLLAKQHLLSPLLLIGFPVSQKQACETSSFGVRTSWVYRNSHGSRAVT